MEDGDRDGEGGNILRRRKEFERFIICLYSVFRGRGLFDGVLCGRWMGFLILRGVF